MASSTATDPNAATHFTVKGTMMAPEPARLPVRPGVRNRPSTLSIVLVVVAVAAAAALSHHRLALLAIALLLGGVLSSLVVNRPLVGLQIVIVGFAAQDLLMRYIGQAVAGQRVLYLLASSWKELALGMLVLALLPSVARRPSRGLVAIDAMVAAYCLYCLLVLLLSPISTRSLYALRGIVEPFLFYALARAMMGDRQSSIRIVKTIMATALLVSFFGLIQAHVLGTGFLRAFPPGYQEFRDMSAQFHLSSAHTKWIAGTMLLRASSTFPGPNEFGMYLAICALCGLGIILSTGRARQLTTRGSLLLLGGIVLLGLLDSLSRSSWLAVAAGIAVLLSTQRWVPRWLVSAGFVLTFAAALAGLAFDLPSFLVKTLTGQEISAAGRLTSLASGLEVMLANPFGTGLGTSGPRSAQFGAITLHTENYYLLLGFDTGVFGVVLYLGMIAVSAAALVRCYNRSRDAYTRGLAAGSLAALIGASLAVNVIPSLQNTAVASLLWLLIGASLALYRRETGETPWRRETARG